MNTNAGRNNATSFDVIALAASAGGIEAVSGVLGALDRYFRGSPARARTHEGSGIGLALVRELVRLHGGRVRVDSRVGAGSSFTVWIPMAAHREISASSVEPTPPLTRIGEASALPVERAASRQETRGARILVVDDNADMRAYFVQLLGGAGWQVETAEDGATAFECAKAARPDLVVTDAMMPKSGGVDLVHRLRAEADLAAVPVVLVSARADASAAVDALRAGANDFVPKPFADHELIARIGAQLEVSRELGDIRRLQRISSLLVERGDPRALYAEIVEAATTVMRSDAASLQLLDRDRGELALAGWKGFHPDSADFWARVSASDASACAVALRTRRPVVVRDVEASPDLRATADLDEYRRSGLVAVQTTPLVSGDGTLVGMLSTHWRRRHEPAERELARFDVLARLVADVIVVRRELMTVTA